MSGIRPRLTSAIRCRRRPSSDLWSEAAAGLRAQIGLYCLCHRQYGSFSLVQSLTEDRRSRSSVSALQTRRISDPELDDEQHYEALKFLLHFIGDIHQPLHTEAEQRGGNGIPVLFNKRHTNLHSIWDNEILEKHAGGPKADEREDARQWADNLYTALPDDDGGIAPLAECANLGRAADCALQWASEANRYVCSYVLKDDVAGLEGKNLAEDYYDGAVPIVDYLIAKAGLRLATWINAIARVQARSTTSLVKDPAQIPIHPRT